MTLHIDKFKQPDGTYLSPEGFTYENATQIILSEQFGFCGCGVPTQVLRYIRDVLQHINNLRLLVHTKSISYDEWEKQGQELFPSEGAENFAYYVMDKVGLTEHGGSVPGWLDEPGEQLLEDLNKILSEEEP